MSQTYSSDYYLMQKLLIEAFDKAFYEKYEFPPTTFVELDFSSNEMENVWRRLTEREKRYVSVLREEIPRFHGKSFASARIIPVYKGGARFALRCHF